MIKLDLALTSITRLGLDTSPFIYFVERHATYLNLVKEIIHRIDNHSLQGYSSVVTLTEVLTQPKRLQQVTIEKSYRDLLLNSRNFHLIPIDHVIAEQAADLRARYNLRTPDAMQIAAALAMRCQAFLTNDKRLKSVTELQILVLDELEL